MRAFSFKLLSQKAALAAQELFKGRKKQERLFNKLYEVMLTTKELRVRMRSEIVSKHPGVIKRWEELMPTVKRKVENALRKEGLARGVDYEVEQ